MKGALFSGEMGTASDLFMTMKTRLPIYFLVDMIMYPLGPEIFSEYVYCLMALLIFLLNL